MSNIITHDSRYLTWRKELEPIVSLMVSQFQSKTLSEISIFAKHSETGIIDTNKLAQYKTTDKIFKVEKKLPLGRKTGFILAIDLSTSMRGVKINNVITQAAILSLFASRCNIPFEVYGFTTSPYTLSAIHGKKYKLDPNLDNYAPITTSTEADVAMAMYKCASVLLLDNNTSVESAVAGLYYGFYQNGAIFNSISGGTPIANIIYDLDSILNQFKRKNPNISRMSAFILTDGVDTTCFEFTNNGRAEFTPKKHKYITWGKQASVVLNSCKPTDTNIDIVSEILNARNNIFSHIDGKSPKYGFMLSLLRQRHPDVKFIGYFLEKNNIPTIKSFFENITNINLNTIYRSDKTYNDYMRLKAIMQILRKDEFFHLTDFMGYDELFYINTDVNLDNIDKKPKVRIPKKIKEINKSAVVNRVVGGIMQNSLDRKKQYRFVSDFINGVTAPILRGSVLNIWDYPKLNE